METVIRAIDNFNFLKLVSFKDFSLWDVKRLVAERITSVFPIVSLGDYIKEENTKIRPALQPEKEHKILGVNNIDGIFDAYTQLGKEIKQPYKIMKEGFLAYNPYRINVGSIGLKTKEHNNDLISPAYVVFSCKDGLNPDFLYKLFKTDRFNKVIRDNTTGSVRQNLTIDILKTLEIPLPKPAEQEEILKEYYTKIEAANNLENELNKFIETYENTLFEYLGISKIPVKQATNSLQFINLVNTSRWGYQYLLNHEQSERLLDTSKFPQKLLSSLVLLNPTTSFSELKKEDKISFLPMECVSDLYGEVIEYRDGDVQSSGGYTKFQEGDLLWSKITPCMQNGKSCIVMNLENGFGYGSTEYHVIREKEDSEIDLRFLYHLLRTKYVLTNATFHFTGSAGQQRVPIEFLANLNVPLPSIDEQKEISKELDKLIADRKVKQVRVTELKDQAIKDFEAKIFKN
jgi:type I restriction enzyme S subunit